MTMKEKIENFTDEQIIQLMTVKDEADLDKFFNSADIHMEDEQKTQLMEYIKTGKINLTDEEMENVTGGFVIGLIDKTVTSLIKMAQGYEKKAKAEGRKIRVDLFNKGVQKGLPGSGIIGMPCMRCGKSGSVFARTIKPIGATANYYDCKCYACGALFPELIMQSQ